MLRLGTLRIEPDALAWLRPAGGVAPGDEALLIGRTLSRAVAAGERLRTNDLR